MLVSGWGGAARHLIADLTGAGVEVVVVTLSPDGAAEAKRAGVQVVRGDSTRAQVLTLSSVTTSRSRRRASPASLRWSLLQPTWSCYPPTPTPVPELRESGVTTVVLAPRAASSQLSQAVLRRFAPPTEPRRATVDVNRVVVLRADPASACVHSYVARPVLPSSTGCLDCLRTGQNWVHRRMCLGCGHVGCCDSSPDAPHGRERTGAGPPGDGVGGARAGLGLVLPGRAAHPCTLIRVLLAHPSRAVAGGEARPGSGVSST